MVKNVVISMLSKYPGKEVPFKDQTGKFSLVTKDTNMTAIAYLAWKLEQERKGERVDCLFLFISSGVEEKDADGRSRFDKFAALVAEANADYGIDYGIEIRKVPIKGDELASVTRTNPLMYEALQEYQRECGADLRVHIDVTGGFRHASMMMLPLVRLLFYNGMQVGDIVYANIETRHIEDVKDLLDVFSLIGGAEEFIAFANMKQMFDYFPADKTPLRLEHLLTQMKAFSDTILMCGNYEGMENTLYALSQAIAMYEDSLRSDEPEGREVMFLPMLSRIKREYAPILPTSGSEVNIVEVIKWCIDKEFLPQAAILYTEWLPHYLVSSGKIEVQSTVEESCTKQSTIWRNWETHLLLNYEPPKKTKPVDDKTKNLKMLCHSGDIDKVMAAAQNTTPALYQFLAEFKRDCGNMALGDFPRYVCNLSPHRPLFKILVKSIPPNNNDSLMKFLRKRVEKEGNIFQVVVKVLPESMEMFEGESVVPETDDKIKKTATTEEKQHSRREVFEQMIADKQINTSLKKLPEFVEQFIYCYQEWRNKISHASTGSNTAEIMGKDIKNSLALLG